MNLSELKLLLVLNGNKRLPYLEEEIFANEAVTLFYAKEICSLYGITNISWDLYYHSKYTLYSRWPEAEHIIVNDAETACRYAEYVMQCRWPQDTETGRKAEQVIKTELFWWKKYCNEFEIKL